MSCLSKKKAGRERSGAPRPAPSPGLQPGRRAKLRFAVLLFAAEGGRKSEKRLNNESEKKEKAKAAAGGFNV